MKIAVLLAVFAFCSANAQTCSWVGSVGDSDWNVSTNWASSVRPTGSDVAIFGCDYAATHQKIFFRLAPPADFSGTIVCTNDFTSLSQSHPTYLELVVAEGAEWKVSGSGTVIATSGIESRIADDFAGTVDVPLGRKFVVPASVSQRVTFTGAGEIVLDSAARMAQVAHFAGKITLAAGCKVDAADTSVFKSPSFTLGDGAGISFSESTLAWGAISEIPDFNTEGAWSFNADNTRLVAANSQFELDSRAPFVTDKGELRLVNDPAQSHTAFLRSRMLRLTDDWGVKFTFVPELPADSKFIKAGKIQEMEGYFGFYLQSAGPTHVGSPSHRPVPGGFGTALYLYRGGNMQHIGWHMNADGSMPQSKSVLERFLGGIVFNKPLDYNITCIDGILTVNVMQEGKSFTMTKPLVEGFLDSRPEGVYIGFGGACGWWSDSSFPWTQMTIRDFKGWVRAKDAGSWREVSSAYMPVGGDAWHLYRYDTSSKTALPPTLNGDGSFDLIAYDFNTIGTASCNVPLAADKRYLIDWEVLFSSKNKDTCEGLSISLAKRKPVAGHYTFEKNSGWAFDQWAYTLGIKQSLYNGGFIRPYADFMDSDNATRIQESADHSKLFPVANDRLARYSLRYEPSGAMEWVLSQNQTGEGANNGMVRLVRHDFTAGTMAKFVSRKGEGAATATDMYLAACGASASWAAIKSSLKGVSVKELVDNNAPELGTLAVEPGATAAIDIASSFPGSQTAAVRFESVKLPGASTLAIGTGVEGSKLSIGEVALSGENALSAKNGAQLAIGAIRYLAGFSCLSLAGAVAFDGELTVIVPSAVLKTPGRKTLLDLAGAVLQGSSPASVRVLDEKGVDRTARCQVDFSAAGLDISPLGMILTVK